MYVPCVCSLVRLAPFRPHLRFGTALIAHPPDWAHTRPHLHRDQVHPPPTSAPGLSRSLAHICTAKAFIPSPHLHRNRIRPSPTSVPPLLPSETSASAWQQMCDAAQCVATTCTVLQPSATCGRSRCGRHMLQPAERCRAALRLAASDPIQASEARARLAESRGVCAAPWTSNGFDASEAVVLARSSRGPRRLSASASASASGLGSAHGPNPGPLSSVGGRREMGHRGPSREAEPRLLLGRAAGAGRATGAGTRPLVIWQA
jgi:hypothetical protein